jgi:hypothetical protein
MIKLLQTLCVVLLLAWVCSSFALSVGDIGPLSSYSCTDNAKGCSGDPPSCCESATDFVCVCTDSGCSGWSGINNCSQIG